MVVKQRSLGRRLWLGDLPLVHSKEGWAWVLPAAGCPATSFCVSVVAARAGAPAQIFIAPVLAFSPPHLAISCHHALTRLALSSLTLQCHSSSHDPVLGDVIVSDHEIEYTFVL